MDWHQLKLATPTGASIDLGPSIVAVIAELHNHPRKRRILASGVPGWAAIERMTAHDFCGPGGRRIIPVGR